MINDLKLTNSEEITWYFNDKQIRILEKGITDVFYDERNKIIHAKIEENFILKSEILFNLSGGMILKYNLLENSLEWQFGSYKFQNLEQVMYLGESSLILVLQNNNIHIIDFFNGKTKVVNPSFGYTIAYIDREFSKDKITQKIIEKIIVICDSNNEIDTYNRNRIKCYLNTSTKKLEHTLQYYN